MPGHALFESWLIAVPSSFIAIAGTLIGISALTYLISTAQSALLAISKADGRSPPTLPYAIPLVGHLVEFLKDNKQFLTRATCDLLLFVSLLMVN
jgi:hypothetical protein